jgi:hypothetical protein
MPGKLPVRLPVQGDSSAVRGVSEVTDRPESDLLFLRYQVLVRVFGDEHYLETVFPDGTRVPAAPQDTDQYRATAAALGYGDDIWRLCREHEIAHTTLMQSLGLRYSPTLWAVAHGERGKIPNSPGEMAAEEKLVLAYQEWRMLRERNAVDG